jgi:hypothetical protein
MTEKAYATVVKAILQDIVELVPRENLYVNFPAGFVGKDHDDTKPPRLVVDLNSLNEMQLSEFISYPNIFKLASKGRKYFSTFDIAQAFFTIHNDEETKKYVGFEILGKFGDKYSLTHNRLPMGMAESPGVISGALGAITDYVAFDLTGMYDHDTYHQIYVDDCIMTSNDAAFLRWCSTVMVKELLKSNFTINESKSNLEPRTSATHLGFDVTENSVAVSEPGIKSIKK